MIDVHLRLCLGAYLILCDIERVDAKALGNDTGQELTLALNAGLDVLIKGRIKLLIVDLPEPYVPLLLPGEDDLVEVQPVLVDELEHLLLRYRPLDGFQHLAEADDGPQLGLRADVVEERQPVLAGGAVALKVLRVAPSLAEEAERAYVGAPVLEEVRLRFRLLVDAVQHHRSIARSQRR